LARGWCVGLLLEGIAWWQAARRPDPPVLDL